MYGTLCGGGCMRLVRRCFDFLFMEIEVDDYISLAAHQTRPDSAQTRPDSAQTRQTRPRLTIVQCQCIAPAAVPQLLARQLFVSAAGVSTSFTCSSGS